MAIGTGLPIPKDDQARPQPSNVVGAGAYSVAQSWLNIADSARQAAAAAASERESAERIGNVGAAVARDALEAYQYQERQGQVAAIANFEVDWRKKRIEARDKFSNDPEGFRQWAEESTAGALGQVPAAILPHAKQFLSREFEGAYSSILAERRATDQRLDQQSVTARLKMADEDVMAHAAQGRLDSPEGKAALATYKGVLESAVGTRLMAPDQADLLTEDLTTRAHGTLIRNSTEQVYREQGFEAAKQHLDQTLKDFGAPYRVSDKLRTQTLSWLRSEEAGLRGERDAVGKEWSAAKGQIETLPRDALVDIQQRAYAIGAIKTGDDIQAHLVASDNLREIRKLPVKDQLRILQSGDYEARLTQRENASGDPRTLNQFGFVGNYQFGAPRLATLGIYKPGENESLSAWSKTPANAPGKWSGTFNIPGFPDVKTLEDFRNNPDAQKAAFRVHQQRTDFEIEQNGLGRFVGQTIGGVTITPDGLRAMIHLGGAKGTLETLTSGGAVNPADANGTTRLDYARLGDPAATAGNLAGSRAGLLTLGMVKKDLTKDLGIKIGAMQASINKTEFPPMDEIGALVAQTGLLGTEEQKRQVAEMAAQAEYGARFQSLPAPQRQEIVARWQERVKNGGTQYERSLAGIVKTADEKISGEWKKDPYAAANRYLDGMPALPAMDWTSPNAQELLAAKVAQQNTIRADQGMEAFSVLRDGEARQLATILTSGDPRQGAAIMRMLATVPDDMYRETIASPPIRAALDGMVRSYDPDRLDTAMSVLDRQYRADPQGFKQTFKEDTLRRLQTWQAKREFTPPIAMAAHFQRADDPAFATARKALEAEADTKLGTVTPAKVANQLGGFADRNVPFVNQAPPVDAISAQALAAEYGELFKERYVDTQDVSKAQEQTVERLKTVWGPSAVAGGALMRHPPERFYPQVDGSHDWMRRDLEASIAASRFGEPETTFIVGPGQVEVPFTYKLVSDSRTAADVAARRPPSYVVQVMDGQSGRMTIPLDWAGNPMRFSFDPANAQREAREAFQTERETMAANAPILESATLGAP